MNPFLGVLFAELRMLLKCRRWWWLVIAGLNGPIHPFSMVNLYLLPLVWLWLSLPRARCWAICRLPGWRSGDGAV
jgi:hypothetical protein